MMDRQPQRMRDIFIEKVHSKMLEDKNIFFLSDDFGGLALDSLRGKFRDRFINVGIAEQNLINISAGLALEGFTVYTYGIAAFLTMRAYEQIRNSLSLLSSTREINVNLLGVGSGLSYDVSGPTHHCLEDIALMRILPNFIVVSPSDSILAEQCVEYSIIVKKPKYFRFDAKPLPRIYDKIDKGDFEKGFYELINGQEACLVTTGYMTHVALQAAKELSTDNISCGVLDVFLLKPLQEDDIFDVLKKYKCVVTVEEAFINKGGLDTAILNILSKRQSNIVFKGLGFQDRYVFELGARDYLHKLNGLDVAGIAKVAKECLKQS